VECVRAVAGPRYEEPCLRPVFAQALRHLRALAEERRITREDDPLQWERLHQERGRSGTQRGEDVLGKVVPEVPTPQTKTEQSLSRGEDSAVPELLPHQYQRDRPPFRDAPHRPRIGQREPDTPRPARPVAHLRGSQPEAPHSELNQTPPKAQGTQIETEGTP